MFNLAMFALVPRPRVLARSLHPNNPVHREVYNRKQQGLEHGLWLDESAYLHHRQHETLPGSESEM